MKGPEGSRQLPGKPCSLLFLPVPTGDLHQSQCCSLLYQPPKLPGVPQWSEPFSEIGDLTKQKGVTYCNRLEFTDCYHITEL